MSRYLHGKEREPTPGLPREIRLPPFIYPVRFFEWIKDTEDDDAALAGCVPPGEFEVWVELTGREPVWSVIRTIIHEARHLYPWPLDDEAEERCVRMLDYAEPQLMRHNPLLAGFMAGRDFAS